MVPVIRSEPYPGAVFNNGSGADTQVDVRVVGVVRPKLLTTKEEHGIFYGFHKHRSVYRTAKNLGVFHVVNSEG